MTFKTLNELSHYFAYEALKYLEKNGPTVSGKEVEEYIKGLADKLDINESFLGQYDHHDKPKYIIAMHFKLVGHSKAGWLKKASPKQGYWTITDEGIRVAKANKDLQEIIDLVDKNYAQWKESQEKSVSEPDVEAEEKASKTVRDKLLSLDPYEFQDLTAALLEGMGYFIDFNAPRGKDGGIDLICYKDPLGAETPRIKVQCKHYPENKISRAQISEFAGVISKEDEIGIFVTSGFYSKDAQRWAISTSTHIRLIDGQELEDMWVKYFDKIPHDKKELLPIKFEPVLDIE